jgi:hypothetical protein
VELTCNRGRVMDLSTRGMRLCTRRGWAEGEQRRVVLRHGDGCATVVAECVWRRRDGALRSVVGLAFVYPGEEAVRLIEAALEASGGGLPVLIPFGAPAGVAAGEGDGEMGVARAA